jgi:hypothetical protein
VSMRDEGVAATATTFVVGLIIGGAIIWYLTPSGPNSGPKTVPESCVALDTDYWAMVGHMLDVAPLGVQLRNWGHFDASYVDTKEGVGGVMFVNDDQIDATWTPRYDELTGKQMDNFVACRESFPDESS